LKFVADESVDYQIVSRLREDGHEVIYIAETQSGASDNSVLNQANLQQAVLLTSDKDFGDLVFRQNLSLAGFCSSA
jgi:predicted nuclease of predicted toxin-antitoxin system